MEVFSVGICQVASCVNQRRIQYLGIRRLTSKKTATLEAGTQVRLPGLRLRRCRSVHRPNRIGNKYSWERTRFLPAYRTRIEGNTDFAPLLGKMRAGGAPVYGNSASIQFIHPTKH